MQLSKNFFRKRFKNKKEYYEDKLLMTKTMIEMIEINEEEEQYGKSTTLSNKKVSFNTKFFSFRASDKRDSGLTKEIQGNALVS